MTVTGSAVRCARRQFTACVVAVGLAHAAGGMVHAAPSVPGAVVALAVGCDRVDIDWRPSVSVDSPLFAYRVDRDGSFLGWVLGPATAVTDVEIQGPGTHAYTVLAVDTAGRVSAASAPVSVAVPSCTDNAPPTIPRLVAVAPTGCTAVTLAWSAAVDVDSAVREYRIYRDGIIVRRVAAPGTSVVDGPLAPATRYIYAVAAVDTAGNASASSAPLTATMPACASQAPVAVAGPDRVAQSFSSLTVDAGGSFDPDGVIASYAWEFGDGESAATAEAVHVYRRPGTYSLRLTVTDDDGLAATDVAVVSITNRPPFANAGTDQAVVAGSVLTFNGRASFDLDGAIIAHTWTLDDGRSATGAAIAWRFDTPGTYVARFSVRDDLGASGSDTAIVTVTPPSGASPAGLRGFGGVGSDIGHAVAVDGAGNVIVGGRFAERVDFGGIALVGEGSTNGFVAKYAPTGALSWARALPSTDAVVVEAVAVDAAGTVVAAGWFRSDADLAHGPVASAEGSMDVFVATYDGATGASRWARTFGAARTDVAYGVATDSRGDVVVTGTFQRTVDFGGGALVSRLGGLDLFVLKLRGSDGAHLWSRSFWNYGDDIAYGIATDAHGDVAVTGFFGSAIDFGFGALTGTGANNAFVAKLGGANGDTLWAEPLVASVNSRGYDVAVEASGDVVVAGVFEGALDAAGPRLVATGLSDTFVGRHRGTDGTIAWLTAIPNKGTDGAYGVAIDAAGDVAVTGSASGSLDVGSTQLESAGRTDGYVARLDGGDGTAFAGTVFGGFGNDYGYGIAALPGGGLAVTGYFTEGAIFDATDLVSAGSADGFVWRVDP